MIGEKPGRMIGLIGSGSNFKEYDDFLLKTAPFKALFLCIMNSYSRHGLFSGMMLRLVSDETASTPGVGKVSPPQQGGEDLFLNGMF